MGLRYISLQKSIWLSICKISDLWMCTSMLPLLVTWYPHCVDSMWFSETTYHLYLPEHIRLHSGVYNVRLFSIFENSVVSILDEVCDIGVRIPQIMGPRVWWLNEGHIKGGFRVFFLLVLQLLLPTQNYALYRGGVSGVELQPFLPTQKYAMYKGHEHMHYYFIWWRWCESLKSQILHTFWFICNLDPPPRAIMDRALLMLICNSGTLSFLIINSIFPGKWWILRYWAIDGTIGFDCVVWVLMVWPWVGLCGHTV